ncbi:hypothetical protein GGE12_001227 [Rhizobium mongolense]|uniref:Uncharacterized protein n=1 Tax=Rhizobium mongolense TaxID=57676 RepID=A0A7W6WDF7_9HYPH|nr:hypothetical protein [Rhizobium mongolense]
MEQVRDGNEDERRWAYREAIAEGVPEIFARRLLDPDYLEPERRIYRRRAPPRPVLAKSRSAFVFATH